jgi:hypothetical protein
MAATEGVSSLLNSEIIANTRMGTGENRTTFRIQRNIFASPAVERLVYEGINNGFILGTRGTLNNGNIDQLSRVKGGFLSGVFKSKEDFIRTRRRVI